jgi:hypothetical protein
MEALKTHVPLDQVVYELLDAHQDTLRLAAQPRTSPEWEIHCAYLRDLQRVALESVGALK